MKLVTTLRTRSRGYRAAVLCLAAAALLAGLGGVASAASMLEERKLPMRFNWNACAADCSGWVSAVGVVTANTPQEFDEFARSRDLAGATMVLDSSGGSVNDAISLGRRWRKLGLMTTVGTTVEIRTTGGEQPAIVSGAYCESMCVFLLLSGKTRYVPEDVRVRVHQIWMGDRADNARAATYSAQDLMIVERDIGRLAKFTFEMGGTGDLLALALSVPPWEDLYELSRAELRLANLVTTETPPPIMQRVDPAAVAALGGSPAKATQDRFAGAPADPSREAVTISRPTKTAEAQ